MKSITGGDTVTARFLYRDEFEFRPAFKLWLIANHAARIRHGSDAIWRGILRIRFEHTVPDDKFALVGGYVIRHTHSGRTLSVSP